MSKTRRLFSGLIVGMLTLALIAGLSIMALGQTTASAAGAAQATTTATPTATTSPAAKDKGAASQLRDSFVKNFVGKLGVDEARLNSAYTGAIGDTVDQAVKDGKLTQAQADKIKAAAQNGFKGEIGFGKGHGDKKDAVKDRIGDRDQAALDAAAKTIGLTIDQLKTELKAGKSIAEVAKSKNVDVAKVKDAMLAAIKGQLDAAVKSGKLTQAQADKLYQAATSRIDQVINRTGGKHK